jgi:para-aminobenzoate synthetase component 1
MSAAPPPGPRSLAAASPATLGRVLRPRFERLKAELSPDVALARLGGRAGRVLLDSAAGAPRRFSLLAWEPLEPAPASADLTSLADWHAGWRLEVEPDAPRLPFRGGFVGALAYDLGVQGEDLELPAEPWGWPLLAGGVYGDALVWDHADEALWLLLDTSRRSDRPTWEVRRAEILEELARPAVLDAPRSARLERQVPGDEHVRRVECARAAIAAGDVYQVNLAHPFRARVSGAPEALYAHLRAANPAPYMGYLEWPPDASGERRVLLSSSPELLFDLDGGLLRTQPIKGTARRLADPAADVGQRQALLESGKDLSELAMIVDLARNDVSMLCEPGSVGVAALPELHSFATVHHLMATVSGRLRAGKHAGDALAALFPAASITGAPKLAAMEHIALAEGEGRGYFTGSLGFWDLEGRACFNVLIRTAQWRGRPAGLESSNGEAWEGELCARFGGGITWRSDARAEDQETLDKAEGWVRALAGTQGGKR